MERFEMKKYQIIYADPAWSYDTNSAPAVKRPCLERGEKPHSVNHYYETMTTKDIQELPVNEITDKNAVLFLWATNPLLPEAIETMKRWGFKYKTCLTWHKLRCKGMGYWFRGHTEHLLLGVKGNLKAFRSLEHNIKSLPVEKHSKKPNYYRELIESVTKDFTNKLEMFAREKQEGWDVWGNEIESDINLMSNGKI